MTPAAAASRLLTRQEAADYLSCSLSKLDELRRMGELTYVPLPSAADKRPNIRFEESELHRFITRHRTRATA